MGHKYLPQYDCSLYIDSSVELKTDPADIFSDYLSDEAGDFVCLTHPWRGCIYDEAEEVLRSSLDYEERVRGQIRYYRQLGYPSQNGLVATSILLRRHNKPSVVQAMELWFMHVLRFSRRDQLSFNVVAWKLNFDFKTLALDLTNNELFNWPVRAYYFPRDFDEEVYLWLNPDAGATGLPAHKHYARNGIAERRPYKYFSWLELNYLANRLKISRGSAYYNRHFYTRVYEHYLDQYKGVSFDLLEIGLPKHTSYSTVSGTVASLEMWISYFERARIWGLYSEAQSHIANERCTILNGSPGDREALKNLVETIGNKPLIIVDDGSFTSREQQISLGYLFSHLAPGGLYFIEDLQSKPTDKVEQDLVGTLEVLKRFQRSRKMFATHLTSEERAYLENNVASIDFYDSMDYMQNNLGQDSLVVIRKTS